VAVTEVGTTRPRLSLAVLSLVLFVTFLDNTIIGAALSQIQNELHADITALQWIVSGYALAFAALMLTFGTLGDHLGRRRVMLAGLGVFTIGSIVSSVATSTGILITGRVIMGIGAAASEPGTLSMIRQLYPDGEERAQALGVWSAVSGLALALGPVIGGALTGLWSWRLIFVFNIAVGLIAMAGVRTILPEIVTPQRRRFDIPGFALGAITITGITSATIAGETNGYSTAWVDLIFALSAVAFIAFIQVERKAEEPVLDLRFFRSSMFVSGNSLAFTSYFSTFAVFFFIPLYIELLGNTSPYQLSIDFMPMAACLILASALSGSWIGRNGPGLPMVLGSIAAGAGILVTNAYITPSSGIELFGWSLVIVGAGLGVVMVAVTAAVLGSVPAQRSGMAASSVNTSRELGAVAGVAVLGAILYGQITSHLLHELSRIPGLSHAAREQAVVAITTGNLPTSGPLVKVVNQVLPGVTSAFTDGLNFVLLAAAALMLASAVLAAILGRRDRTATLDQ
jgi:EmrB/QacA subfamily drug resistance transporter